MTGPKVLTLDIETSPHLAWTFQTFKANIAPIQIVEPTRMLCFAAKWLDGKRRLFHAEWDGADDGVSNHFPMVQAAHRLLDEADVLVTYNGDKFDIPHLNREFELAGLKAPSPFVSVDMYKVLKRDTVWASHKLAWITQQLSLTGKLDHTGFQMWLDILNAERDPERARKARRLMRRYNIQDVVTLEELFVLERHRVKNMPSATLFEGEDFIAEELQCPNCNSVDIRKQGFRRTKTRKYQQYQCQECGSWFHDTRSSGGAPTSI